VNETLYPVSPARYPAALADGPVRETSMAVGLAGHLVSKAAASVRRGEPSVSLTQVSLSDAKPAASDAVPWVRLADTLGTRTGPAVSETLDPASESDVSATYIHPQKSTGATAKNATSPALTLEGKSEAQRLSKRTPSGACAIPAALTQKEGSVMSRTIQSRVTLLQLLIAGIGKYFAGVNTITLAGTPYAPSAIAKILQDLVDAINAAVAARTAAHVAVQAASAKSAAVDPVLTAFKSYLLGVYTDAKTLADFGLTPRKPRRPLTQEEGAAAAAKRLATRAARHTLGKRQKASIHGTAPEPPPVVTPPPSPTVTPAKS
jgi:hypothetical protein